MMDQRKTSGEYEKTRVDCCTALGVAGRGAITTTAAGCRRPDKHIATPQYRCYLPRRNSRDVLQCTHQPEPSRLWINRGIRRRVRIGRRCRQHHAVHPSLFGIPTGQRTVQLTEGLAALVLLVVSARNPRRQFSVPDGVLDVLVAEAGLRRGCRAPCWLARR